MTFREKLVNWLTFGMFGRLMDDWVDARVEASIYAEALESISSIPVTPSSNGQTRKAVRIAKEALQQ